MINISGLLFIDRRGEPERTLRLVNRYTGLVRTLRPIEIELSVMFEGIFFVLETRLELSSSNPLYVLDLKSQLKGIEKLDTKQTCAQEMKLCLIWTDRKAAFVDVLVECQAAVVASAADDSKTEILLKGRLLQEVSNPYIYRVT